MSKTREKLNVNIAALLVGLAGIFHIDLGFRLYMRFEAYADVLISIVSIIVLLLGILAVAIGVSLWRRKAWALRFSAVITGAMFIITMLIMYLAYALIDGALLFWFYFAQRNGFSFLHEEKEGN
ncbi:hypothetical protein EU522_01030 [Candidatus Thorarchaeota archaeon]|nr:MAG: hypothetical protein EU522_01030 [Candidatus Thorarchaeota archaeon]